MPGRRRFPPCGQPDVRPPLPAHPPTTYCPKTPYIRKEEKIPSGEEGEVALCPMALRPGRVLPRRLSLATVRCQSIYIVPPSPSGGTAGQRGDELTKAGNARWASLGSHHLPDDAGDPEQDADRHIFSSSAFLSPARPWLKP